MLPIIDYIAISLMPTASVGYEMEKDESVCVNPRVVPYTIR